MFNFLHNLLALIGLIALVGGGFTYYSYDSIDPCRMLAHEQSQVTIQGVSDAFGGDGSTIGSMDEVVERTYQMLASQMTSGQCTSNLADLWWGQMTGE